MSYLFISKKINHKLSMILLLLLFCPSVFSANLDPSCLKSLQVKNKKVTLDNRTLSCPLLEASRGQLFLKASELLNSDGISATNTSLLAIAALELELDKDKKMLKADKGDYIESVSVGNIIATMGLIGCPSSAGLGCVVSVAGFVWAKYGIINGAASIATKKKAINELKQRLTKIKNTSQGALNIAAKKDHLIGQFNQLCQTIKKQCL